ncbi:Ethanolamine ammonia-lyase light chain [Desulforamulus reducens MI-1]|uniref:Ethanolamine ammonia-lyase small subunit n=1 Tax=Desulforamulus reducens (strain ATCC BAA-1160 / DSM 100696 / MI-1) TaxID=349161 RepID=A4J427_DESRM|nr:ethanolamine ammonia-lyase subunit EutC [Desulforamulus reducens]ABO49830.1 Ethanolamine ammonia-lyase light chain [Desulforamulus reducens MI-1]
MIEEQIRQIVQAVISQMTGDEADKPQRGDAKTEPKAPDISVEKSTPPCCGSILEDVADEDLEDLSAIDLQKEILIPNPADPAALAYFKQSTPARIGVWRCGARPLTRTLLRFRADHATAQDAVFKEVDEEVLNKFDLVRVQTKITDKDQYLTRPDLGRQLLDEDLQKILQNCPKNPQVQIVIADGLSSRAVEANLEDILPSLKQGLAAQNLKTGKDIFVKFGRVDVMDQIGKALDAEVVVLLVGERPGLGTSESMSAYMVYKPGPQTVVADHTVVSNIHKGGTPPAEAGAHLATVVRKIYDAKLSGVKLTLQ